MKLKLFSTVITILLFSIPFQVLAEGNDYEIPDVPVLSQNPELPTGCEATATTMLLQWAGVQVNKSEVADALPKEDMPS